MYDKIEAIRTFKKVSDYTYCYLKKYTYNF